MKFINYLESITGIGIYPLVSLIVFFSFFTVVGIYLIRAGKKHFEPVSRIPLDNSQNELPYENE